MRTVGAADCSLTHLGLLRSPTPPALFTFGLAASRTVRRSLRGLLLGFREGLCPAGSAERCPAGCRSCGGVLHLTCMACPIPFPALTCS